MISTSSKGIFLEQNKEPALSRDIVRLEGCDEAMSKMDRQKPSTPELLAPYEIIGIAREADIIDESDGRRLWKKLATAGRNSVSGLAVDAIDDEPYISSQLCPAIRYKDELSQGIALAKRSVGASEATIEIYKNLFDIDVKIPSDIDGIKVVRVGGRYPAEQRRRWQDRRKSALGIGACALIHLKRAIYDNIKHTTCYVTVAGDCVAYPANYEVPIGTTVRELLREAGLVEEPKRVIAGGSMTGFGVLEPDKMRINPNTRGVLAFANEFEDMGFSCIGCGRCTAVCPQGLSPYYIYKLMKKRTNRNLKLLDVEYCDGCGTCSYVCPAKLELSKVISECAQQLRAGKEGKDA